MSDIPEDVMKVARAMLASIDQDEVYIGGEDDLTFVTIDGRVNVLELARIAILAKRTSNAQIHNLLYEALELIDAPLDLLQIVGSWKDTMPESETLAQLEAFVAVRR